MVLISVLPKAVQAGAAEDWQGVTTGARPAMCDAILSLLNQRIAKARSIQDALKQRENGPPPTVLDMFERITGTKSESDFEREKKQEIEKEKQQANELNDRYKDQRCGSVDVDEELAKAPTPQGYKPLTGKSPKPKY